MKMTKEENRTKYFDGRKSGLANLAYQSRQSEFGHLGAFLVMTGAALILQRHHRMRIDKLRAVL
jgi:hypothetical protein